MVFFDLFSKGFYYNYMIIACKKLITITKSNGNCWVHSVISKILTNDKYPAPKTRRCKPFIISPFTMQLNHCANKLI